MEIQIDSSAPDLRHVRLTGRLDAAGVGQVDVRFLAATAGSGKDAIADLTGVAFIASLGIRLLVDAARALKAKDRRMVLVVADGLVRDTLRNAGIDQLIATVASDAEARAFLAAA
ncbi:MAG: STAS domain-containing protein [Myxococcota bacterium]